MTQDESYGKPYGTLSREAQDAISKELDVVPETEARVLVHKMGDNWICELKPEGSRQKVKIKLLSTITP